MTTHRDEPSAETRRFTAQEILQATLENARGELRRSIPKLAFSGIAGGITMGLTGLGVAIGARIVGDGNWQSLVSFWLIRWGSSQSSSDGRSSLPKTLFIP